MIIQLVGPPASGKTTFAKWFLERNQSFQLLTIDHFRLRVSQQYPKVSLKIRESYTWSVIENILSDYTKNFIFESTGTIHHSRKLWQNTKIQKHNIVVISFNIGKEVLKERISKRIKQTAPGYDLPDNYALDLEFSLASRIPAHLQVKNHTTEAEYIKIEEWIYDSMRLFEIQKNSEVIGNNKIPEGERK